MKAAAAVVLIALAHGAVAKSDFCPFAGIDPPETQLPEGHAPVPLGSTKGLHGAPTFIEIFSNKFESQFLFDIQAAYSCAPI